MVATDIDEDVAYDLGRDDVEYMSLVPEDTGLPLTVWAGPRGGARHDVRIKVCTVPGARMISGETAVVSVRPWPKLLHGDLSTADFNAVRRWVEFNEALLVDYWDGRIQSRAFATGLQTI